MSNVQFVIVTAVMRVYWFTICTDCNGLDFVDGEIYMEKECEYHVWYACKKHRDKSCLECKHNSNLDLRNT